MLIGDLQAQIASIPQASHPSVYKYGRVSFISEHGVQLDNVPQCIFGPFRPGHDPHSPRSARGRSPLWAVKRWNRSRAVLRNLRACY